MQCDIKWHDIKQEMPGTDYDVQNNGYFQFLIRYSFEDDLSLCCYTTACLINGSFKLFIDLDSFGVKSYEELEGQFTITHWALIDHLEDYD